MVQIYSNAKNIINYGYTTFLSKKKIRFVAVINDSRQTGGQERS